MQIKKIISIVFLSTFIVMNMVGCQKPNIIQTETKYYSSNIYGDRTYYDEDYEEIPSILSIMDTFLTYSINVDYTNEEYLKQLDAYTDEIQEQNEAAGFGSLIKSMNVARELIRTLDDYTITDIEFYTISDVEHASVTLDYISTVVHAIPEFLEGNDFEPNVKYIANTTVQVQKQSDGWRIVEIMSIGEKSKVE